MLKFDLIVFSLEHERDIFEKTFKNIYLYFGVQILHLLKQLIESKVREK